MSQRLILGHDGRGAYCANHEAGFKPPITRKKRRKLLIQMRVDEPFDPPFGNVGQLRCADGQMVHRQCNRLPMEIPARDHTPLIHKILEDCRRRIDFNFQLAGNIGQRIPACPMDLRRAAQGIGILHPPLSLTRH